MDEEGCPAKKDKGKKVVTCPAKKKDKRKGERKVRPLFNKILSHSCLSVPYMQQVYKERRETVRSCPVSQIRNPSALPLQWLQLGEYLS